MPTDPAEQTIRENLTRDEAEQRAAVIGAVEARVQLDLTRGAEVFGTRSDLRFEVRSNEPTFVDLTAVEVHEVSLDGTPLGGEHIQATRIELPAMAPGTHHLEVEASAAYGHEGKALHRFVDPTDDRVYLHSQFEPFEAHRVYACFDQPDLKTTFALDVDAPAEWVVVSNAPALERPVEGRGGRWRFATTPVISTYITAIVAGPYVSVTDRYERADGSGIELAWWARRSLIEHVDAQELFTVTKQGFAAFERMFETRYPFGERYDQLFVPEFAAGAMENPSCVTYTEAYVFRSKVTDAIRERRAETIIHEMAHMWFGDLVTMRWWDDLWLNESFATFMAVLVQSSDTRWEDAWVTFLDAEKAWAKMQDQLPSTHPVADQMPDVESVHQNFDGITYAKGASVLRQLVAWVGQEEFLAGCRDYFDRHAWGNTTLADFLAALERASGRRLDGWRDDWLLTTGVNRLALDIERGHDGTLGSVAVRQSSPTPSWAGVSGLEPPTPVLRPHRVAVGVYDEQDGALVRIRRVELDVTGEHTEVPELVGAPSSAALLPNDDDLTYAKLSIDEGTLATLTERLDRLADPLARAQVWATVWDMVRDGELPATRYIALVVGNASAEPRIGSLQRLLLRAEGAAERYAASEHRAELLAELATAARGAIVAAAPGSDQQLAWVRHWAGVARAVPTELADVRALLDGSSTIEGLELDTDLRWHLVTALAAAGVQGEEAIAAMQAEDPTDLGERSAATARAAQPTAEAKQAAWDRLIDDHDLSHTLSRQLWSGFVRFDQQEVLAPFTDRYLDVLDEVWRVRSLDWAIDFTAAMFPHWDASPELLSAVDKRLSRDDLPRPQRRALLEERDVLVRTLDARTLDAR